MTDSNNFAQRDGWMLVTGMAMGVVVADFFPTRIFAAAYIALFIGLLLYDRYQTDAGGRDD